MLPIKARDLHDKLSELLYKQNFEDVALPVSEKLEATIEDLHFFNPANAAVLHVAGQKLKNCVGSYKSRVLEDKCSIVLVENTENRLVACIEIGKDKMGAFRDVRQSKLYANACSLKDPVINEKILKWMQKNKLRPDCNDLGILGGATVV